MGLRRIGSHLIVLLVILCFASLALAQPAAPKFGEDIAGLQKELTEIQAEIKEATEQHESYTGGLIKSLIAVRLEILKSSEALIKQRIYALEAGVKINYVEDATKPDPARASDLAMEIDAQKGKLAEAQAKSDMYTGGLIKAMSETNVATIRNTIAMLEQKYLISRYGLFMPQTSTPVTLGESEKISRKVPGETKKEAIEAKAPKKEDDAAACLKVENLDSSILSSNEYFVELAWKADVKNACDRLFRIRVKYTIYDKDDFELDSDDEYVTVPSNGVGKARGKMNIYPAEKAHRMSKHSARLFLH